MMKNRFAQDFTRSLLEARLRYAPVKPVRETVKLRRPVGRVIARRPRRKVR